MKAITVLYGGSLSEEAFIPLENACAHGKSSFELAMEHARRFPHSEKTVLLGLEGLSYPTTKNTIISRIRSEKWTRKQVLEAISQVQRDYDIIYFAWADCPFLDPVLAAAMAERHVKYAAEYSYADGYPYGFAPELLSPGTPGILYKIDNDENSPVERDMLFQVIQKDINAFDIETEISPVDLRQHRLCLAADSRRNLLLINRWLNAGILCGHKNEFVSADNAADLIKNKPDILRTLPSFYNIQICESCPQTCSYCPWPKIRGDIPRIKNLPYMDPQKFSGLLDKIVKFSSDAVISFSLWGEPSLHPQKMQLINMVLERPELSLVIETSGIGWANDELQALAAAKFPERKNKLLASPLSWIISLDAIDPNRYKEIRGPGYSEAIECAKQLLNLFPGNAYVQAVRFKGAEDDIEVFYRQWKSFAFTNATPATPATPAMKPPSGNHVIIQKYDDFCGFLPKLQASDLSPVKRKPCWHLMREMNIAIDGTVLRCREDLKTLIENKQNRLNVFDHSFNDIWLSGNECYIEHTKENYPGDCANCDEYYTYNF